MRLLLDTHVVLWWISGSRKLTLFAKDLIADPANEIFVSAASIWEVAIKRGLGRIEVDLDELRTAVDEGGFRPLDIDFGHASAVWKLPSIHRDPFDRMLVAQSRLEHLVLVTRDEVFLEYDLRTDGLSPILV